MADPIPAADLPSVSPGAFDSVVGVDESTGAARRFPGSSLGGFIGFQQSGTGAVARTMQDKARDRVSLLDYIPTAEHAAIRAGTSAFDCADAMDAAIAAFTYDTGVVAYIAGPRIEVPEGRYYFSRTINLKKAVAIIGVGAGTLGGAATTFVFPVNTYGIIVNWYKTLGAGLDSPFTFGGDGSLISGIKVICESVGTVGHGIWLRGRAKISEVWVVGFGQDGVSIVADVTGGADTIGNANNWRIDGLRTTHNGRHGLYTDGGDVNAGVAVGVDSSHNGGWGIFDSSFLGNTYVGCHTATNVDGAYKSDNINARNTFVGCYSEGDQPASSVLSPALVLGGIHEAGFTAGSTAPFLTGSVSSGTAGALNCRVGVESDMSSGTDRVVAKIGGSPNNGEVGYFSHSAYAPIGWRMRIDAQALLFSYAGGTGGAAWRAYGPNTTTTFGRSTPLPYAFQTDKLVIGDQGNGRRLTARTAAPSTGDWARGDLVMNTNAVAGGKVGWVCVTAGTPGTWKPFGAIDP